MDIGKMVLGLIALIFIVLVSLGVSIWVMMYGWGLSIHNIWVIIGGFIWTMTGAVLMNIVSKIIKDA